MTPSASVAHDHAPEADRVKSSVAACRHPER